MSSTDRRAREQQAVRERILAAARALFVEQGYAAVSLRKVAEAIDYTAPALYTHFKDKEEMLRELCRRDFADFARAFQRIGRIEDPVLRIYRIGMAYLRFAHEHPHQYRFMFMTPELARVEPQAEDLARQGDPDHDAYAVLQWAVRDAMAHGCFRPGLDDGELIAQTLWAAVHGLASLQISHGDCPWMDWRAYERRARLLCESTLRGLLSERAAREFKP